MAERTDTLTASQEAILLWLWNYPSIFISWGGPLETSVDWTATWVSAAARNHMAVTVGRLVGGDISSKVQPRGAESVDGSTPRIGFGTFKALLRRGLIEVKRRRKPREGWSPMLYYGLSEKGKQAYLVLRSSRDG